MTSLRPFALQPVAQRGLGVGLVMAKLTFRREARPTDGVAKRAASMVAGDRNQSRLLSAALRRVSGQAYRGTHRL